MPLDTMAVLLALGLLAASLAGVRIPALHVRRRVASIADAALTGIPQQIAGTPDDGPLGLGAGRTTRCPICARAALELVGVSATARGHLPQVRCGACLSTYAVRGTLTSIPQQRRRA